MMKPIIIVIAGSESNTGKTTLLCELLRELSQHAAWEAIKLTRGHYRSCGKDPHACCVSHLLGDAPTVRSGRAETYTLGKDTGHYWEAGASNVHWVIATDAQVEQGVNQALARVQSGRVLIEGTSVLRFVEPELAMLVMRGAETKLKPSARRALVNGWIDALYLSDERAGELSPTLAERQLIEALPRYTRDTWQALLSRFTPDAVVRQSASAIPQTQSV